MKKQKLQYPSVSQIWALICLIRGTRVEIQEGKEKDAMKKRYGYTRFWYIQSIESDGDRVGIVSEGYATTDVHISEIKWPKSVNK